MWETAALGLQNSSDHELLSACQLIACDGNCVCCDTYTVVTSVWFGDPEVCLLKPGESPRVHHMPSLESQSKLSARTSYVMS